MLVLSSPTATCRSTIAHTLLERDPHITMSVSCTTRPPRPGEVDGKNYHFVGVEKFEQMVEAEQFLEHARVCDNLYGTPEGAVENALAAGRDLLFDIDWQGARQLRRNMRADLVTVFILPPSTEELERRLRTKDNDEAVAKRMAKDCGEMSHWFEYDYILLDAEVERSIARVQAILDSERLRRDRQIGMAAFVNRLHGQ